MCHICVLRCVIICQRCQDRQDHFVEDDAMMSDSLSSERLAVATQLCVFQAAATNRTAVNETLRLSSNIFRFSSYLISQSWSKLIFRIANKHQLQNLNQTSTFWLNLNFKILTKPSLRISTSIKLHNLKHQQQSTDQNSASKSRLNFNFKILTNPCAPSLNKN